ncbi:unnamed protein product [Sphagnum balticum]
MLVKATNACLFLCLLLLVPAFAIFQSEKKTYLPGSQATRKSLSTLKSVVLWSWQNDDNLIFIDPDKVSVAGYCGTILIDRERVNFRPRLNALLVPDGTVVMPVFRVVTRHPEEPLKEASIAEAVDTIAQCLKARPSPVVQIDFDATVAERRSYLALLKSLRLALPRDTAISVTALASWCLFDQWLERGAADEAVAMMFSMGRGQRETLQAVQKIPFATALSAKVSLGISANEPSTNRELKSRAVIRQAERIYIFATGGWSKERFQKLISEVLN